jgi:hypothetical protein
VTLVLDDPRRLDLSGLLGSLCVFNLEHKHWTAGELTAMKDMELLVEACFPLSPTG